MTFTPFDPARKMSEATAIDADGHSVRIVKGAFAVVALIAAPSPTAVGMVEELQAKGFRVLAVAVGATIPLRLAGLIALSDPPRDDLRALIAELSGLGVRTIMVTVTTGTASVVAAAVGITGPICTAVSLPHDVCAETFGVFADDYPRISTRWFRPFSVAGTLSACAAMAPMTLPHYGRRRWDRGFHGHRRREIRGRPRTDGTGPRRHRRRRVFGKDATTPLSSAPRPTQG